MDGAWQTDDDVIDGRMQLPARGNRGKCDDSALASDRSLEAEGQGDPSSELPICTRDSVGVV